MFSFRIRTEYGGLCLKSECAVFQNAIFHTRRGKVLRLDSLSQMANRSFTKFGWNSWVTEHVDFICYQFHGAKFRETKSTQVLRNVQLTTKYYVCVKLDLCWVGELNPIMLIAIIFSVRRQYWRVREIYIFGNDHQLLNVICVAVSDETSKIWQISLTVAIHCNPLHSTCF